ncbi:MAG TPA: hypothetical protein VFT66_07470 [Roseiflexaceae bacterium]|nr:hypothetical protein [Roseiflexaceae bacterium]
MIELPAYIVELDRTLIDALLAGEDTMLQALRGQYAKAVISRHDFTGVGFFTHFTVGPDVPRINPHNFDIGDISLDIVGVDSGVMANLAIREGVIDYLEVITYADDWPENPVLRSISYQSYKPGAPSIFMPLQTRNLDVVRKAWAG